MSTGSGIRESIEWKLLDGLCRQSHRITPPKYGNSKRTSKRKNSFRKLNIEMRKTFQRRDLEVILDLDPEDKMPSSQYAEKVSSLLQGLCDILDRRVNTDLPHLQRVRGVKYPNLDALLRRLKSPGGSQGKFELVSMDKGGTCWFAVLPGEDTDETQKRLAEFNSFVDGRKLSGASLDELARTSSSIAIPSKHSTFDAQGFGGPFRRLAVAACRAIFFNFSNCNHHQKTAHKVLLQLPRWDKIASDDTSNVLELFLTSCPVPCMWQEAQVRIKPDKLLCRQPRLCDAINAAQNIGVGLEFYVHGGAQSVSNDGLKIQVRNQKEHGINRKYHNKSPAKTLRKLMDDGAFKRCWQTSLSFRNTKRFEIDERKSLAFKLVFGLLISLGSDHIIETWDPEKIYFLASSNGNGELEELRDRPYVSCGVMDKVTRDQLALPKSDLLLDGYPPPSPVFTLLAKILLEISFGDRLDDVIIDTTGTDHSGWKKLRDLVEFSVAEVQREGDCRPLPFLAAAKSCLKFHYSYQAEIVRLWNKPGNQHINEFEIAKRLIYDEIICKIDETLPAAFSISVGDAGASIALQATNTGSQVGANYHRQTAQMKQPHGAISLFDTLGDFTQDSREANWARDFFVLLEDFRQSCEGYMVVTPPRRTRIAVLDTGINKTHGGIEGARYLHRIRDEWCHSWVGDPEDVCDDDGHGTHCAYLLHKVAPEADIYVAKVFSHNQVRLYQAENIAKAIHYAVKIWNVDIISMSFGLCNPSSQEDLEPWHRIIEDIKQEIKTATPRIMFAAASNSGKNNVRTFPSVCRDVICIHASDGNGNEGDINPPNEDGDDNFMTLGIAVELLDGGKYCYKSGTSLATPIAAGIAANILELAARSKEFTDRAKERLKESEGMRKMFQMMSKRDQLAPYRYIAPWHHWPQNWAVDENEAASCWSTINAKFNYW